MSIWSWIGGSADGGTVFGAFFEWVGGLLPAIGDPTTRRQVAFSVALIALSAKMAKADGIVTSDEVRAFERMFSVPAGEEKHVARLFDLARKDVAGFETYAGRIAVLYEGDREALEDVVDGLFAIAGADGTVHEAELVYLERVSAIFSIDRVAFEKIMARHVITEEGDPYLILGIDRSLAFVEIKARYRVLAAENHPDRLMARGVPPEAAAIAHERMAAINRAFERIERERRG